MQACFEEARDRGGSTSGSSHVAAVTRSCAGRARTMPRPCLQAALLSAVCVSQFCLNARKSWEVTGQARSVPAARGGIRGKSASGLPSAGPRASSSPQAGAEDSSVPPALLPRSGSSWARTRTVPSREPVAKPPPSWLNSSSRTSCRWPLSCRSAIGAGHSAASAAVSAAGGRAPTAASPRAPATSALPAAAPPAAVAAPASAARGPLAPAGSAPGLRRACAPAAGGTSQRQA